MTPSNVIPDDLERKVGNLSGKIPVWDYARITYIDPWGRTEPNADTATLNTLNQFFSPGYYSKVRETEMEHELLRLYEATGENGVLISAPSKYLTVNNERKDLTADEYLTYAITRGQTAFSMATDLTAGPGYASMTDAQRAAAVERVFDYADQTAKEVLLGSSYISGDIHEGANDDKLRPMFVNYDEVKAAWENLVTANSRANTRQEGQTNGQQTERIERQEKRSGRRGTEKIHGQISEDAVDRQDGRLRMLSDGQTSTEAKTAQGARGDVNPEGADLARMQQMSWGEQIENREELPSNSALYLRETPYLLSEVGLGDLPMCMTVKHLSDVMHERSLENTSWHGISKDVIERLPELISKPAMIMDSNSRRGDILVVTTEIDADGNPIVVSIRPNGKARVGGVLGPANFITSVYGRENFAVKRGRNSLNNLMYLASKNRLILY